MADNIIPAQQVIDNSMARAMDIHKTQWTDDQALIFLNRAYDYVHQLLIRIKSAIVIVPGDITISSSTPEYLLSDNLPNFWAMADDGVSFSGSPLTPIMVDDARREGNVETDTLPECYYLTDSYIGLSKTPSSDSVALNNTLTCRYYEANIPLLLDSAMPYKNLMNEPMTAFMDHLAIMKIKGQTAEFTELYNSLESSSLEIANRRLPK